MRKTRYRVYIPKSKILTQEITGFECNLGEINRVCVNGDFYDIKDVELSESTGLYDKGGKEIFVGDIVKNAIVNQVQNMEIIFEENRYICITRDEKDDRFDMYNSLNKEIALKRLKVIGNIYQNKELLKMFSKN